MHVNTPCDVCDRPHPSSPFIVPDTHTDRWDYMCPMCLDTMLQFFSLNPRLFLMRELTDSYHISTYSSSPPRPPPLPRSHPRSHPSPREFPGTSSSRAGLDSRSLGVQNPPRP